MTTGYPFWLGGLAALMAGSCTHPLDVVKVRMQTSRPLSGSPSPSTMSIIHSSISQFGLRNLYAGLTASFMRQMSYSLVRIGSYEKIKEHLSRNGKPSTLQLLLAASLAGALGGVAGNPSDIILVRMTSDLVREPDKRYNYSNALTGLISLFKSEGARGLGRGIGTNTARAILMNASQVCSYDFFKGKLVYTTLPVFNYELEDNLLTHFLASCSAGTVATTICSPADVLRSRVMASSSDTPVSRVLIRSFREEGPTFLFKGWVPAFVRLAPNTVLLFVFLEQLKKAWNSIGSMNS